MAIRLPPAQQQQDIQYAQQPEWGGRGGGDQAARVYAYNALTKMLGHPPTEQQLAQAAPSYIGTDPNVANQSGGDAYVSQMAQMLQAQQPEQSQQTADTSAQQGAQNIQAQFQNLYPELQKNFMDPLNQAIQSQQAGQSALMDKAIGGVQGLTNTGAQTIQDLTQKGLTQQGGINSDLMKQLQGINTTQNDLLGQRMTSQRDQLMNQLTTGPEGEAFREKYNGLGLLNSGAFNTGLANQFGNLASQQQQDLLGLGVNQQGQMANAAQQGAGNLTGILGQGLQDTAGTYQAGLGSMLGMSGQGYGTQSNLGLGGLNAQQNTLQMPVTQGLGQFAAQQGQGFDLSNLLRGQMFNQTDFQQQATLAQLLGNMGQPSGAQSALGMANGSAQGLGSLLQGGAQAKSATSYVCLELIRRGLLCQSDLDDFHVHIMPALFKKGRAFWKYAMDGRQLVDAVNAKGMDWAVFKPLLFDRVMEERDPVEAVNLYADACHQLCLGAGSHLWDERVMRNSVVDSLRFIPLLLAYAPFLEALGKCLRVKMLFLYDKPRCAVHR